MSDTQTTYARAALENDAEHEGVLLGAITEAIFTASKVRDANIVVVRTAEASEALTKALALVLALSPATVRSPTAIRRVVDNIGKRLRRRFSSTEKDADLAEFVRRNFWGSDTGGNA